MQLSWSGIARSRVGRGATLDSVEKPLNNRRWLRAQFAEASALATEESGSPRTPASSDWTDPGPGGFYDDLGNAQLQPHLVRGLPFEEDPQRFKSARPASAIVRNGDCPG